MDVTDIYAQSFKSYPTKNVLEYSLSSLYNRAEQIAEQNKWLEEEMGRLKEEEKKLRYQTTMLDKEMAVLNDRTFEVKDEFEAKIREAQLSQTNMEVLTNQIQDLADLEFQLQQEFESRQQAGQRLQAELQTAQTQLAEVDLPDVDESVVKKDADLKLKKSKLSKVRLEMSDEIAQIQKHIQKNRESQSNILDELNDLREQQDELKGQLHALQAEVNTLKEKRDELSSWLDSEPKKEQQTAQKMAHNVMELQKRRTKLARYLNQVKTKLNRVNLGGDITQRERQLQKNVLVIKKENTQLMTQLDNALLGQ